MRQKMQVNNERGLTLVEILASLIILGIVFVAFMTIFPQMSLFNNRTETKLETMNEARIELEKLKEEGFSPTGSETFSIDNIKWWRKQTVSELSKDRVVMYEVKQEPVVKPKDESLEQEKIADNLITLHEATIKVYSGEEVVSETFGYVRSIN